MARREQKPEPQHADGAPEWMVTFSDCMTLLLTFFVLLLSFSSFDERVFWKLRIIYSRGLSTITPITRSNRDAFTREKELITAVQELSKGSEQATPEKGNDENMMKQGGNIDLDGGKVILIPSQSIFWGHGETISSAGCETLSILGKFLAKVPNRIVISEHGPPAEPQNDHFGLPRAWAVSEYLIRTHGINDKRLNISAAGTARPNEPEDSKRNSPNAENQRQIEILLLDRSIHD
ncbi:MAG: hypothetical protein JW720_02340 [Sedimentisphaerales bacterium]|nr:hypothetical protein [Sedimentisphaerales bacterium]